MAYKLYMNLAISYIAHKMFKHCDMQTEQTEMRPLMLQLSHLGLVCLLEHLYGVKSKIMYPFLYIIHPNPMM